MALTPGECRTGPCFCFCDFFCYYANLEFSVNTLRGKKMEKKKTILGALVIGAEEGEEEEIEEEGKGQW